MDSPEGQDLNARTTGGASVPARPRTTGGGIAAKRVNVLYAVLAAVAAAAAGAWLAGSRIESPADVALRTAPPTPSPILVPVESRVLSSEIVARGTVRFGLPQPISLAPSTLKPGPGVITSLPLRNTQLREGDVILTASARPVFVLQGQVPAYRDLVPGISGDDVRQLKEALRRLGFDPGPADGSYDQRTGESVTAFYKAKGWEPFGPTRDQVAAFRTLERDRGDAAKAQVAATAAAATAGLAVEAARAIAVHNNRLAALEGASRAGVPMSVLNERAKAEHANAAADADLAAQIADQTLVALDPRQTETARAAANAKLEVARAARQKIKIEGDMAIQAAEREAALTGERAELARASGRAARLEGERAVQAGCDSTLWGLS